MRERARENRRFALNKNEKMQHHFFIPNEGTPLGTPIVWVPKGTTSSL